MGYHKTLFVRKIQGTREPGTDPDRELMRRFWRACRRLSLPPR